ncbi:hypothetical protein HPG69_015639 [Diceros bicornis minor]|uniref:Uncharacterized protein n=1 Tax=Diceros bicornis minor TaxID=77932 RepID=A0A7J7E778_DICBM|nr:hypothetical protein HPG69_015639 [Diceros bicornis minor]
MPSPKLRNRARTPPTSYLQGGFLAFSRSPPILGDLGLFLLEKSFLGGRAEDFLYLKPGSGGERRTRSRGDRDSALMQEREGSAPGALASPRKPAVGAGRLPWPSLALSRTPAQLIAQLRVPAGPRQTQRSESAADPREGGAAGGSGCSCSRSAGAEEPPPGAAVYSLLAFATSQQRPLKAQRRRVSPGG